jgi:glutaminyl-peptide cyclotransferase
LVHGGFLYEGTGNYRESRIRKMELSTGNVLMERPMSDDVFGEGITIFGDKVYQLTYKGSRGFVYDLATFDPIDEFTYNTYTTEGWGLTHNDTALIASDGSAILYFFDPATIKETARLRVFNQRGEVSRLNELEYHDGIIYANIYTTAEIVAIDAGTGRVVGEYSVRGLIDRSEITTDMDVLNGIAINPLTGNFLITGKYWPKIYEVRPVPRQDS